MSRGQVRPQIFILDFSKEKLVSSIKKLALLSADFGMRIADCGIQNTKNGMAHPPTSRLRDYGGQVAQRA